MQSVVRRIQQLGNDVLELLYPRSCQACTAYLLATETQLCTGCISSLPYTNQAVALTSNAFLHRLEADWLTGAAALCHFEALVPELVHQFKYGGNPHLAQRLGQLLGTQLQNVLPHDTVLVPIPLHPRKLRSRGYNQAEWIANGLRDVGGWQVEPRLLRRIRHTVTQTGLDRQQRQQNVSGVFQLATNAGLPASIAIVDDVVTTGATTLSAASVFHAAGVRSLYVVSVAEVDS